MLEIANLYYQPTNNTKRASRGLEQRGSEGEIDDSIQNPIETQDS